MPEVTSGEGVSVPLDDAALNALEDALGAAYAVDDLGNSYLARGEFTLTQLLEFWSGFDKSKAVLVGNAGDAEIYEYPDPVLHPNDVIRALIAEVRTLRGAPERI